MSLPYPEDAKAQTVQSLPDKNQVWGSSVFLMPGLEMPEYIAAWPTVTRQRDLRHVSRQLHNSLFQGTLSNIKKEIGATPWSIEGKRDQKRYHDLLLNAEFGAGWQEFIDKIIDAWAIYDYGAPIEIIGRGKADAEIKGSVSGLAVLDPVYCHLTGNPEYPIVYQSEFGGWHQMHRSRVFRIINDTKVDRDNRSVGYSPLSSYLGSAWRQQLMGKFIIEKLSDVPVPGFIQTNMNTKQFDNAMRIYEADRNKDGQQLYRNFMHIENIDPDGRDVLKVIPFSEMPDNFDYQAYMEVDVKLVALAFGVDPQDVWTLTGQAMGTAAQSYVLADKAKRRSRAFLLKNVERMINMHVLPPHLRFVFQPRDEEAQKAEAEYAERWVAVANSAGLTPEQRLRLLANKVVAIADVLTDAEGNIQFADDDIPEQAPRTDVDTNEPSQQTAPLQDTENLKMHEAPVTKDYADTRGQFERRLTILFEQANSRSIKDGAAFERLLRQQLRFFGPQAYIDGAADGNVKIDALDDDGERAFKRWMALQMQYTRDVRNELYTQDRRPSPEQRARLWVAKSLNAMYQQGLLDADANGMYIFAGTDGVESCKTCIRLKGQVHRLKDWARRKLRPQIDTENFICGGWECQHELKRSAERARGRF